MKKAELDEIKKAWQTLYYADLLSDKEAENIKKKIATKEKSIKK